jgi:hypothetical protein
MNDDTSPTDTTLHDLFDALRAAIDAAHPQPSRERALAHTKLDECGLWLSAAKDAGK